MGVQPGYWEVVITWPYEPWDWAGERRYLEQVGPGREHGTRILRRVLNAAAGWFRDRYGAEPAVQGWWHTHGAAQPGRWRPHINLIISGLGLTPDWAELRELPRYLEGGEGTDGDDPASWASPFWSLKRALASAAELPWDRRGAGPYLRWVPARTAAEVEAGEPDQVGHLYRYVMRHPAWGDPDAGPPDPEIMVSDYAPHQRWGARGGPLSPGGGERGAARRAAWRELVEPWQPEEHYEECSCGRPLLAERGPLVVSVNPLGDETVQARDEDGRVRIEVRRVGPQGPPPVERGRGPAEEARRRAAARQAWRADVERRRAAAPRPDWEDAELPELGGALPRRPPRRPPAEVEEYVRQRREVQRRGLPGELRRAEIARLERAEVERHRAEIEREGSRPWWADPDDERTKDASDEPGGGG